MVKKVDKTGNVLTQREIKEILSQQLQLLAEASKTQSKPEDLLDLTRAMALIVKSLNG